MTDYEIRRLSRAIVEELLADDRFIARVAEKAPKAGRMMPASEAARMLGVSKWTVIRMAGQLGGEKRENGRWYFPVSRLGDYCKS